MSRSEIKRLAKEKFLAGYGINVGAYALFVLIIGAISSASLGIAAIILTPAFTTGYLYFCTNCYRGAPPQLADMFEPGFQRFGRVLGGTLWMQLFIFLWSLLFIVPGIIKSLAYSQTPYILANEPDVNATAALRISMRMTYRHKGRIFVWLLSFLGWRILSMLTFGILEILWVGPYVHLSFAGLYQELRAEALRSGAVTQAMLDGAVYPE